jgi:hypothetical protein
MYKTISILSLALTALTAAPTSNTTPASASSKAVPYFRFGTSGTEHNEMAVSIQNLTGASARVTLEMYGEKGELVEVPYFAGDNKVARAPRQSEVFGPHGTRVWRTSSKGEGLKRGWLRVISEPAGAFAVLVHGNTAFNGGNLEQMFTVNQQAGAPVQFLARFDNGALDHLVVANNSSAPDQLTLIARAADGVEMCRTTLPMKPAQYYKHYAKSYLACTDGKAASVEVRSETGTSVAMAFVYPVQGGAIVIQPPTEAQASPETTLEDKLQELYNKLRKSAGY